MKEKEVQKPVAAYLELLEKKDDVKMNQIYWWTKLDSDQMMEVMQQFCWDNSIDFNMVNWANFLNGKNVPKAVLWE